MVGREVKFRAWDGKVMHFVDSIEFPVGGTRWYGCGVGKGIVYANPDYDWKVDSVLMQYTGLHDKNGIEIYEGDIVKTYIHRAFEDVKGKICYADKWATFYLATKNKHGVGIAWSNVHEWYYSEEDESIKAEVIGNIYENEDDEIWKDQ